ncbi:hypothetical protein ACIGXM_02655 [Kitasatospora sp. NPDC052896]|uniref:hypothetical protein n=1 Tax=Kitasatospora sp. NPDC052896 TaxID=3364061 RepID=UPI0037CAD1C6
MDEQVPAGRQVAPTGGAAAPGRAAGGRRGTDGGARTRRLLAVPVLGALLASGAVACSSDNSSAQLDSWAKTVCDGMRDPVAKAQAALSDTGQVKQGETPGDLQQRLSGDLGVLASSTQQIAAAINQAGAPKSSDGASVQQDVVNSLDQAAKGYQAVQQKLAGLPTNDQAKFADGLKGIGDQVQQLAQVSTSALAKVQGGDLGKAITKQPGCKSTGTVAPGAGTASGAPGASGSPAPGGSPGASGSPAASGSPGAPGSPSAAGSQAPSGAPSGSPSAAPGGSGAPSSPAPAQS